MKPPHKLISPSRMLAYNTLVESIKYKKNPEQIINHSLKNRYKDIKRNDLNLAYEIIYGSFRWWDKLYWILQNYSKRDLDRSSLEVKVSLVGGTYQIFYLDRVPNRASINESAEFLRAKKQVSAVAFINGMLRQVAIKARYFPKPEAHVEPEKYLALQYAQPIWLVKRWIKQFGFAKLEEMYRNINKKPSITIRFNRAYQLNNQDMQKLLLKDRNRNPHKRPLRNCFHLNDLPNFANNSLFARGLITIQDESSQLIAHLVDPQKNQRIVDACAGPGGKLSHLYDLCARLFVDCIDQTNINHDKQPQKLNSQDSSNNNDDYNELSFDKTNTNTVSYDDIDSNSANDNKNLFDYDFSHHPEFPKIYAFEKKQVAYDRLIENITRMNCSGITCTFGDFVDYSPSYKVDKILLDAPCSGFGVLRRHPEAKMFKTIETIDKMVDVQRKLFIHAFNILSKDSELVYSVCSSESEEIYSHLDWLQKNHANCYELIDPSTRLQSYYKRFVTKDKVLLIYGGNTDSMDGFGAFIVKKTI